MQTDYENTSVHERGGLQRLVGRNLRSLRLERNLSQAAFAADLGFARSYMGDVERGVRNITLKSLEEVAHRAGVSALKLLEPDDQYLQEGDQHNY